MLNKIQQQIGFELYLQKVKDRIIKDNHKKDNNLFFEKTAKINFLIKYQGCYGIKLKAKK